MLEAILEKIGETLAGITQIKEVFNYPLQGNPKKFPAVVYYPVSMQSNEFNSQADNYKVYTFNLSIIMSLNNTTVKDIYASGLPKIIDKVVAEFDEKWNMGVVDGHRVWVRASSGEIDLSQEQAGAIATQNITLEVKCLTDV